MQGPTRVLMCVISERLRLLPLHAILNGQNFVANHRLRMV
jgi:hypothetical protein